MTKSEQYIKKSTRRSQEGDRPYNEWVSVDCAKEAVEIAKEEMIEKAREYLDGLIELLNDHGHGLKKERIIGGLKQAMEE